MKEEYNPFVLQKPLRIFDCNRCKWLNLTEAEQRERPDKGLHFCQKYNKRLYHRYHVNEIKEHGSFIYPCDDCEKDEYEHYTGSEISIRIGVDHAEFCVHKILQYQETGKRLLCNECPISQCRFYGCPI